MVVPIIVLRRDPVLSVALSRKSRSRKSRFGKSRSCKLLYLSSPACLRVRHEAFSIDGRVGIDFILLESTHGSR